MDVGGKDAKDAWMAANYLKALPYVDRRTPGVWGLSYGGFFTLIAATDQPTLYRAAVNVAGVADYAMYYEDPYHGGWTASRSARRSRTRRSSRRRRRCRTSIGWRGRCSCCTARPTSTSRTCTRCG
jgi:dipeptidyl aminopeptidase/acylaminoacyl peptidase